MKCNYFTVHWKQTLEKLKCVQMMCKICNLNNFLRIIMSAVKLLPMLLTVGQYANNINNRIFSGKTFEFFYLNDWWVERGGEWRYTTTITSRLYYFSLTIEQLFVDPQRHCNNKAKPFNKKSPAIFSLSQSWKLSFSKSSVTTAAVIIILIFIIIIIVVVNLLAILIQSL